MTTQPPPIEFKVRADARQAQEAIDGLNKKFKEGETASSMLDKRIEALTKDLDQLSTAIVSGKGNTEAYRAEMQRLERQLDALHGVAPQVSSSVKTMAASMDTAQKSTRNVGQAALEVSRGLEDLQYGVGGIVNNIPSLVMALGGTAGLTAVLSLAAVGVNQLYKAFTNVDKGAEEATKAAGKHVNNLRDDIADLADELRALQIGADRAKMEKQQAAVDAAAKAARDAIDKTPVSEEGVRSLRGREGSLTGGMKTAVIAANEALKVLDDERAKLAGMRRIQEEKDSQAAIDRAIDEANAITAAEERRFKSQEKLADKASKREDDEWEKQQEREKQANERAMLKANTERLERAGMRALGIDEDFNRRMAMLDAFEKFDKDAKKEAERAAKLHESRLNQLHGAGWADRLALSANFTEEELKNLSRLTDEEWKLLKDRQDQWASFYEGMVSYATSAATVVANAGQKLIDDRITGEELAFESFYTSIMKQAGQSLVASGISLGGKALESLLTPGFQPVAAAQFAGSAALIGGGMALGGIATGIMHQAKGGTIGQALPDKDSRKDRGASPSSSGGSSSGGPLVVNISYGVGGPLPEDTAREVRKVLDVDSRR